MERKEVALTITDGEFMVDVVYSLYKDGSFQRWFIHPHSGSLCEFAEQTGYGWSAPWKEKYLQFVEEVDRWLQDLPVDEEDDGRVFEI